MPMIPFKEHTPQVDSSCFVAPDAWITGNVTIKEDCSIFFNAVLRGDILGIHIGKGTNIQDHAMLHTSIGLTDTIVGNFVTVGHSAILHGCKVNDYCIIGMGAILLDGAVINENCMIGAHSLVTMNTIIPPGTLAFGNPAKVIRDLNKTELDGLKHSAERYIKVGKEYKNILS